MYHHKPRSNLFPSRAHSLPAANGLPNGLPLSCAPQRKAVVHVHGESELYDETSELIRGRGHLKCGGDDGVEDARAAALRSGGGGGLLESHVGRHAC